MLFGLIGADKPNKTIVYDSFNRVDSASSLGVADTGQAWNVFGGIWGIDGGKAYCAVTEGYNNNVVINTDISDGILTVKLPSVAKGAERVNFRWRSTTNRLSVWVDTDKYAIYKYADAVETLLGSYSVVPQNNDVIKIEANGSLIKVYLNDLKILEIIESANIANTNWGFGTYYSNIPRFDSFKVEAI